MPVTLTPVPLDNALSDPTAFPQSSQAGFGCGIPCGPWFITGAFGGDAWYALCEDFGGPGAPQIFKSTDDRATWTLVGEYGSPTASLLNSFLPPTGTVLYLLINDTGDAAGSFRIQTWDFSTDTFGTVSTVHPTAHAQTGYQLIVQPSGQQWVFFDNQVAGVPSLQYTSRTAGVWAGVTTLFGSAGGASGGISIAPACALMEASGRFHLWFPDEVGAIQSWHYVQVSAVGAVGSTSLIYSVNNAAFEDIINGTHLAQILGTQIFFPFAQLDNNGDGNQKIACLIGTPLAAPVWTFAWVDPTGAALPPPVSFASVFVERDAAAVLDKDGNLLVFFTIYNPDGVPNFTHPTGQIWYGKWNGASFDLALFFDALSTPFVNQTILAVNDMFAISMMSEQKSDGSWTMMVQTQFAQNFNQIIYTRVMGPITLTFDLIGSPSGTGLARVNPSGPGPSPILTPTECINQQ